MKIGSINPVMTVICLLNVVWAVGAAQDGDYQRATYFLIFAMFIRYLENESK